MLSASGTAAFPAKVPPPPPHRVLAHLQVRAEFLDILLAVLCFTAPEIEGRLRQVGPGRGRAGAAEVAGAAQLFALAEGQPEAVRKVGGGGWCGVSRTVSGSCNSSVTRWGVCVCVADCLHHMDCMHIHAMWSIDRLLSH
jgi:hypothetical protein